MSSLQHGVSLKALLQNPDLFDPAKALVQGLFFATILYSYVRLRSTGKTYVLNVVIPVLQLAIDCNTGREKKVRMCNSSNFFHPF